MVSAGTLNRNPVSRACWSFGDQARASLLLDAERGPAPVLLELLQKPGPRQGPLVADELGPEGLHERGGAHLADAEEPLDVAPGEELPVELLELADGVGDGEQPPGLRGHRRDPQRRAGWRRREWFARSGGGRGRGELDDPTPAARPGRPGVTAGSSTSAGKPRDPPGPATAEAGSCSPNGTPGALDERRRPAGPFERGAGLPLPPPYCGAEDVAALSYPPPPRSRPTVGRIPEPAIAAAAFAAAVLSAPSAVAARRPRRRFAEALRGAVAEDL